MRRHVDDSNPVQQVVGAVVEAHFSAQLETHLSTSCRFLGDAWVTWELTEWETVGENH